MAFVISIIFFVNFKSLAVSAAIALSAFTGVPANAAPTTCAARTPENFAEFQCDHHSRINANGHKVQDITYFLNGKKYLWTIVLWADKSNNTDYAEVWINGNRSTVNVYVAKNGGVCLDSNANQFCFKPVW